MKGQLTDPVVWPLATRHDQDFAIRPGDRDGAAHDTGYGTTFGAHG